MKKIALFLLPVLLIALTSNEGYSLTMHDPVPGNLLNVKVSEVVKLSAKQFAALTGRKMDLFDRFKFSVLKMKMRHDLKKDPNLLMKDYLNEGKKKMKTGWKILIIIGCLLIIGLIIELAVVKSVDNAF